MRVVVIVLALAALIGGSVYAVKKRLGTTRPNVTYKTEEVTRGPVTEGVQASGTVQPVVLVQVGTQVSGVIQKLFKDYKSKVKAGETVALIDPRRFLAQVAQDEAAIAKAKADVERVQAQLVQAERDLARTQKLAARSLANQSDLDAAVANEGALRAQLALNRAVVAQAEANLKGDVVNLEYCTIVSPIDGVVVSRTVGIGQTVAASFNTPTLFTIANDLKKVVVQASVPEADIGKIRDGQRVHFTVDAYPDMPFPGTVSAVHLDSTTVQNVVTYPVLIDAENPDEVLFPGMTANVTFEVATVEDTLRVPASALRLQPKPELLAAGDPAAPGRGPGEGRSSAGPKPVSHGTKPRRAHGESLVYVETTEGFLRSVPVREGISDGTTTAVAPLEAGALAEGSPVVTAVLHEAEDAASNPFMPSFGRGKKGGGH